MKPICLGSTMLLALIPAGVFYGWGGQALAVFGLSVIAMLVCDVLREGRKQPNKIVFISDWPRLSMQWDSHLSQGQIIELIDKIRAHVLAPQSTKQTGRTDNTSGPKEATDD